MAHHAEHKLFVGQVPKTMQEDELKSLFLPFGNVKDSIIIRDRETRAHKGCAFVTYETRSEAEACIQGLHGKITLPGMTNAMQVKYAGDPPKAGSGALITPMPGTATTHKLFIGMLPKHYTEEDVKPLFQAFGDIKDCNVLRGPDGVSKGCAFLLFAAVPSAVNAIATLNGKIKLEGANNNLVVQFATSDRNKAGGGAGPSVPNLLGGGLGGGLPGGLFVPQQNFLDPYAGLTNSAANAATNSLAGAYGAAANYMLPGGYYGAFPGNVGATPSVPSNSPLGSNKEGPPGSNLFIYHIPTDYTDASLFAMYSQFGNVISCKVITEKGSNESKGFGFVSYDTPESAQLAVLSTNGMQLQGGKRLKVDIKQPKAARPY